MNRTLLPLLAILAALPAAAGAQELLTLDQALRTAEGHAYSNRIAAGESAERRAQPLAALPGILPSVRVETGWMRTTDPIGAFGTALRHRDIGQEDFAPDRLNRPDPVGTWTASLVLEQPLLNLDAHAGRVAASRAAAATGAAEGWTRASVRLDVIKAYWGAVLAEERVTTLEAAVRAAQGHVRQARSMVEQGLATRSDALLAEVKAGELDADLLDARGRAGLARRELATVLGRPEERDFLLPERLPGVGAVRDLLGGAELIASAPESAPGLTGSAPAGPGGGAGESSPPMASTVPSGDAPAAMEARADVRAARLAASAARADVARARSLYLPRINAFARYDWYSADAPFDADESWTAGVMASWSPFAGAGNLAEVRGAGARDATARARREAAEAAALLDLERSRTELEVALGRLAIAERAVEQSAEAHRIVERKYEGGLATVVELLDAAAVETRSRMERSGATWASLAAGAERLRALGRDPGELSLSNQSNPEVGP